MKKDNPEQEIEVSPLEETAETAPIVETTVEEKKERKFSPKKLVALIKRHPRRSALVAVVILVLLFAVPITRYPILGLAIKKPVSFKLVDSQTGAAVSEATLSIRGQEVKTDSEGIAKLSKVPVGKANVTVKKKYYETATFDAFVGLKAPPQTEHKLKAEGRPVNVRVLNKVSGKAVENAVIKVADEDYKVDKSGEIQVIVPGNASEAEAVIKLDGYNELKVKVAATDANGVDDKNVFKITPAGKIYFLSKASGKIDVVKTNLDGSERQTVLAGTGKEDDGDTILLASRDWKYAALKSRRDSDKAKLYLLDTATDKLSVMDEGNAEFTLTGWHNEFFIFTVDRSSPGTPQSQPKRHALKSFNAQTSALKIIDETQATNNNYDCAYESFSGIYILPGLVAYTKNWVNCGYGVVTGKVSTINTAEPNGNNKRKLYEVEPQPASQYVYISSRSYALDEVAYQVAQGQAISYFELEDGSVKPAPSFNSETFNKFYPTFIVSPSAKKTFWYEPRDGKNTIFVGNDHGKEGNQIASLSELVPYGWHSDEYLLASKKGSELYILPTGGLAEANEVLKITDYHKPAYDFSGYGYGYGGF